MSDGGQSSGGLTGRIAVWSTAATAVIGLIAAVLTFSTTILEGSDGTEKSSDGDKPSASTPAQRSTVDEYSPTDPAFDPLLEPLAKMTKVPIMLPAELPDEMDTPVVDDYATDRDRYRIVFSLVPTDETVASLSNAETLGDLRAYPEVEDESNQYFEAKDVQEIEIPDGTDAIVRYMVPAAGEGVSQGPFWEGKFDAQGYTYVITIVKPNENSEDQIKQAISTMVTW